MSLTHAALLVLALAAIPTAQATAQQPTTPEPPEGQWAITWDRGGVQARPRVMTGILTLGPDQASLVLHGQHPELVVDSFSSLEGWLHLQIHELGEEAETGELRAFIDADTQHLYGYLRWGDQVPWSPLTGFVLEAHPPLLDPGAMVAARTDDPATVGLELAALEGLVRQAQIHGSQGICVAKDGVVVVDRSFGSTAAGEVASITKVLAAQAVPFLLEDGLLPSLDTPLGEILDAWSTDEPRGQITVRHMLTHTSGLEHAESPKQHVLPSPDRSDLALGSHTTTEPGTVFSYNDRAMGLLPVIVHELTGQQLDSYLEAELLGPLGLQVAWRKDATGTPAAYGGARTSACELVALGQLFLDAGVRDGAQLLPATWVEASTTATVPAAPEQGLAWKLQRDGSYGHSGAGGQHLWVMPELGIVAARLHARDPDAGSSATNTWRDFPRDVKRAAGAAHGREDEGRRRRRRRSPGG